MTKRVVTTGFPRPRTLIHPGRFNPVRIQSHHSSRGRHVRLALLPGVSLFDGLVKPLAEIGITSASTTILGGYFEGLQYCVAPPDQRKQAVIAYSKPIIAGRTYMIFGNATLGKAMNGSPLVHCHAAIRTESGDVKGGHILTDTCIVGRDPIPVLVTSLDEFELRQAYDPETNIPLLQPFKGMTNG
jgi:predicted DNA-binding protein with PD1-like motif